MDAPDAQLPKRAKPGEGSLVDREKATIRAGSLEAAIVLAFAKRIAWAPALDIVWHAESAEASAFAVPDVGDVRVRRLAMILRALQYDNLRERRGFGWGSANLPAVVYFEHLLDPATADKEYRRAVPPADRTTRRAVQLGRLRYHERIRRHVYETIVRNPRDSMANVGRAEAYLEVKPYLVGRAGTPLVDVTHRRTGLGTRRAAGLVHVLAFLYDVLPAIPWARHPSLTQSDALVSLGLYQPPASDDPRAFPEAIERGSPAMGLTSVGVLQYALDHHFRFDVSAGDDPFWTAALTIIADGYIRAAMDADHDEHALSDSDEREQDIVVPTILRRMRVALTGGGYDRSGIDSFYGSLIKQLRHEIVAIRRGDYAKILSPPPTFMYPYGQLTGVRGAELDRVYPESSLVDPSRLVRDLLAMSYATRGAPVASLRFKAKWNLIYAAGRRILEAEPRETLSPVVSPAHVIARWAGTNPLRRRAWVVAAAVVVLAMRNYTDTHLSAVLDSPRYLFDARRFLDNALREPGEHRATYLPYYYPHYLIQNTRRNLDATPIFWGAVAYIALFIHNDARGGDYGNRLLYVEPTLFDRAFADTFL